MQCSLYVFFFFFLREKGVHIPSTHPPRSPPNSASPSNVPVSAYGEGLARHPATPPSPLFSPPAQAINTLTASQALAPLLEWRVLRAGGGDCRTPGSIPPPRLFSCSPPPLPRRRACGKRARHDAEEFYGANRAPFVNARAWAQRASTTATTTACPLPCAPR